MTIRNKAAATLIVAAGVGAGLLGAGTVATGVADATVIVDPAGQSQTRPSQLVLTAADAGEMVTGITWFHWSDTDAHGVGVETVKQCVPNCAEGKSVSKQALITLSDPVPSSSGSRFTRAVITTAAGTRTVQL